MNQTPASATATGQHQNGARALVLGAGIAGLYSASRLVDLGYQVDILESSDRCGGTHRSANIGPYTFDVGSIFYNANSPLFNLAEGLKEQCSQVRRRQRRIAPSGEITHYPVDPKQVLRSNPVSIPYKLASMAMSRLLVRQDGTLDAICRKRMGRSFYEETGLKDYISRFHQMDTAEIDELFFFERMQFIDKATRILGILRYLSRNPLSKRAFNPNPVRGLLIRPYAGFDELFSPIRQRLEKCGVVFHFNQRVEAIDGPDKTFRVTTDAGEHRADAVVSTIPLDLLHQALFGEPAGLRSIDMTSLFVSAEFLHDDAGNVLFNFSRNGAWKRATIYSRLYPEAATDREFFTVEVTLPEGGTHHPEKSFADAKAHLESLGLARNMRLEGSDFVPAAYPLHTRTTRAAQEAAMARVQAQGILPAGRQGRFAYLPTSDLVIRKTNEALNSAFAETASTNP